MGDDGGYTLGAVEQCTAPDRVVRQGVVTEVDIESVAAAGPWLDGLKNYLQERLIPDVGKMMITEEDINVLFGGLSSAGDIAHKHIGYVRAAIESYRNVAESLDAASRATADIVDKYEDVEHNNTITVQNLDAAFLAEESGGGDSPAGASGGGSDQGSF